MTLKQKLNWTGELEARLNGIKEIQDEIASGKAERVTYYWFVGQTISCAIEVYLEGDPTKASSAFQMVVDAALLYFYGNWRSTQGTPDGKTGHEAWKPYCLWYDEVQQSLPFAAALSDWQAMKRIAEYPPENKLPEADKAKGETAWGWALVSFLRGQPRSRVEEFLRKAAGENAKRPKLLAPILRALLDNDSDEFGRTLTAYLAYFRKSEFKHQLGKLVTLEGTTLYHLGRKQGFEVELSENVADHVLRLE